MEIITALISAFVGGIIATFLKTFLEKRKDLEIKHKALIEDKYRSLLIFMACTLDIDKRRYFSMQEQIPNLTSEDYMNQIKEYYYHSILYSSDNVILSMKQFIKNPSKEAYITVAQEMRKELWGKETKLNFEDIILS
jgi:hypothetical protein